MDQNQKPETAVTDLHKTPKRPFVELIISNSKGAVMNTISAENPELAKVITRLAELTESNGFPIVKVEPLMPLAQDIFMVDRALVLFLLGCFHSLTWQDVQNLPKNFPETAQYTLVVSY